MWKMGLTRRGASCTEHVCKSLARRLQISSCGRSNVNFSLLALQEMMWFHEPIRCEQVAKVYSNR